MSIGKGKRERLEDIEESLKIARYTESMIRFLMEHKDEKLAELDNKIAELQTKRQQLCERIERGPEELAATLRQIAKLEKNKNIVSDKEGRLEKLRRMQEAVKKMEQELGVQ